LKDASIAMESSKLGGPEVNFLSHVNDASIAMESSKLGGSVVNFISHVNYTSIAMESLKVGWSSSRFYLTCERHFHRYGISQGWVVK
jgi:hypothetical protein